MSEDTRSVPRDYSTNWQRQEFKTLDAVKLVEKLVTQTEK